ncbi:hypothetical protein NQ318_010326 [Aromia moschata]|uniref:BED-type domain-containing protein n=1 Tax=Aromia moschata TaxID=1265417 RepID=A0AAV8YG78_9CUCU|nr:hypothetical protein NQ318_010326 [Aromia moschata]
MSSRQSSRKSSRIWHYFTDLVDYYAKCNICGVSLSYRTTTSNLKKHLLKKHKNVDISDVNFTLDCEGELQEYIVINPSTSSPTNGEEADVKPRKRMKREDIPSPRMPFKKPEDAGTKGLISIGETLSKIVSTPDDDDEIFGKFLTVEIKKFTDKKMKNRCKRDILSVLMEYCTAEDDDAE